MVIAAVDPGQKGGVAILKRVEDNWLKSGHPMPMLGKDVDCRYLYDLLEGLDVLVVENIQLRGKNAGNATTAKNWGRIWIPAEYQGIPVVFVQPQAWQRSVHGKPTSDKSRTVEWALANGLPVPQRPRGAYHDGVADAWGIMRWYLPRSEFPLVVKERPQWAL